MFFIYWCTILGIPATALQAFNETNLLANLALPRPESVQFSAELVSGC